MKIPTKELGLLSIKKLIKLDLGVLMFKVNEGLQDRCVICFTMKMLFTSVELEVPPRATSKESKSTINFRPPLSFHIVALSFRMRCEDR